MKRYLAISVVIGIGIIIIVWGKMISSDNYTILESSTTNKVVEDFEKIQNQEEKVLKWIPTADIGHLEGNHEYIAKEYGDQGGLVKYFFASLSLENPDMFIECFMPETISKDLFKSEEVNKKEVVKDFIQRITRNGQLDQLGFEIKEGVFGTDSKEMELVFIYKDGIQISVPIQTEEYGHFHGDEKHTVYGISTSVFEIIEKIESTS